MKYLLTIVFALLFAGPAHAGLVGSLVNLDPQTYSDQWRVAGSSSYLILDFISGSDDLTFTEIVEVGTDAGGDYCDIYIGDSPGGQERVYLGDVHEITGVYVGAVSHNTQKTRCLWAYNFEDLDFLDEVTPDQDIPTMIQEILEIDLIELFGDVEEEEDEEEEEEEEEEVGPITPDFCTETDTFQDPFVRGHVLGLYNDVVYSADDYCAANPVSVFEYYCEDGRNHSVQIDCEFGCVEGVCIDPDSDQFSCEDTDGYDIFVKGTVSSVFSGQPFSAVDHCTISTGELGEYSCEDDQIQLEYLSCEFGCLEGACIQPEMFCNDTDGSQDPFLLGYNVGMYNGTPYSALDYCRDDNSAVFEYYCQGDRNYSALIDCEFGCVDGVCIDPDMVQFSCEDSDNGDLFVAGQTSIVSGGQDFVLSDYCALSTGELAEVWCDGDQPMLDSHDCEFGCEDGACLQQAPNSGMFASVASAWNALAQWLSSLLGN